MKPALFIEVLRGDTVESRHRVVVSTHQIDGRPFEDFGSEQELATPIFPRSAIKPLQSLLLLKSGAFKAFNLNEKHLALSSSSHEGEKMHLEIVREWMEKIEISESDFVCGGHWPSHIPTQHQMIRAGQTPGPSFNNCSGKHLGLITVCRHLGYPVQGYEEWNHPLQKDLRNLIGPLLGEDLERGSWGIDGCGIPNWAMPTSSLARGLRHLLTKDVHCQILLNAMMKHPELVGGSDDFTSRVIERSRGKAVVKTGAEGVFGGVLMNGNFSFALKALDGNARASQAATIFLLRRWGALGDWELPLIKNWRGDTVGSIQVRTSNEL